VQLVVIAIAVAVIAAVAAVSKLKLAGTIGQYPHYAKFRQWTA